MWISTKYHAVSPCVANLAWHILYVSLDGCFSKTYSATQYSLLWCSVPNILWDEKVSTITLRALLWHQQPWNWLCKANMSFSSRKHVNYFQLLDIEILREDTNTTLICLQNSVRSGLYTIYDRYTRWVCWWMGSITLCSPILNGERGLLPTSNRQHFSSGDNGDRILLLSFLILPELTFSGTFITGASFNLVPVLCSA